MRNIPAVAFLLLVLSCSQPSSVETFLRGTGPYEFTVEMTDTTASYHFDLFTRIDATEYPSALPLEITWKDPQGGTFTETVSLPVSRGSSFFSQEAYVPYRAGVVPQEYGTWTVTVTVPAPPEGIRGLGLVTRKVWATEN